MLVGAMRVVLVLSLSRSLVELWATTERLRCGGSASGVTFWSVVMSCHELR